MINITAKLEMERYPYGAYSECEELTIEIVPSGCDVYNIIRNGYVLEYNVTKDELKEIAEYINLFTKDK